ncbi:molybdate ABC transporter substrate-binding protein [Pseudactinotalea sp. Z1739]|uniref:molybdate ABC transporter substrate-binding protein n=1 Tax=Pseudactinotalea sp. Z1739 TaxID=3413028 RepID=UPI003C7A5B75
MPRSGLLAGALAAGFTLGACGTLGASDEADPDRDLPNRELTVFAAASLHVAFTQIGEMFTAEHPDVSVAFSFAGSSNLVAQLDAGAPADVLAAANEAAIADAAANGTIEGEPVLFATNVLTLITPAGNPARVTGMNDSLAGADLVVCASQVPCGQATAAVAGLFDVDLVPVSEEGSVTDVLGKITSGQADAGLVYNTDAASAGERIEIIEVYDQHERAINHYPMAVTTGSDHPDVATAWIDFVLGSQAQAVLDETGFGIP